MLCSSHDTLAEVVATLDLHVKGFDGALILALNQLIAVTEAIDCHLVSSPICSQVDFSYLLVVVTNLQKLVLFAVHFSCCAV